MILKNEIEIEYFDRKTKVSLPEKYSDFIKLCKETFYLSESRSKDMNIIYYDEEEDEIPIDEDEYNNKNARNASFWILKLNEDDDNNENEDIKYAKDELIIKKNDLLNQAKKYKSQLLKKYNEIIESEVKKRNDKHKENIKKIKEAYEENLINFKKEINNIIKESLQTISKNVMNIYNEGIVMIDDMARETLKKGIDNLQDDCVKEFDNINTEEISKEIENSKNIIKSCENDFYDIYNQSQKSNNKYEINEEIKKECIISRKGIKFNLDVKNKTNKQLKGDYILDIKGYEGTNESFQIKLDLSDVGYNKIVSKEITFKSNIRREGNYKYRLFIKENNNKISNESKLFLKLEQIGSMSDIMQGQ